MERQMMRSVRNSYFMSYYTSHLLVVPLWLLDLPAVTRMLLWASIILSHRDSEEKPANCTWGKNRTQNCRKADAGEAVALSASNLLCFHLLVIVS